MDPCYPPQAQQEPRAAQRRRPLPQPLTTAAALARALAIAAAPPWQGARGFSGGGFEVPLTVKRRRRQRQPP